MAPSSQTQPSDSDTEFPTRELSLAAFLSLRGYRFELRRDGFTRKGRPRGLWVFEDRDGELWMEIQAFNEGGAKVEPTKFLNEVSTVRELMFEFLGISNKRS